MALVTVSGIGRRAKKSKAERKQVIKNKLKKRGKLLLKWNPATATARNAFLLLVKLNLGRLATHLAKMSEIDSKKLEQFWKNIGGSWSSLRNNINIGKNKRQKNKVEGVGVVVAAGAAAAVVSATPIILKIVKLLKSVGIEPKDLENLGKKVVEKVVKKKIDAAADEGKEDIDEGSNESSNDSEGSNESSNDSEGSNESSNDSEGSNESSNDSEGDTMEGISFKTVLPIVGLLAGIYILSTN